MRFQGRRDIPLNEKGRAQARRNGKVLKAVLSDPESHDFICSPMDRARETMEIIRAELALGPQSYRVDERLIEAAYGDLEGTTLDELKANQRELHRSRKRDRWNFQPPGGESLKMAAERVRPVLDEISQPTVIVAHGAVGRAVRKLLLGISEADAGPFHFSQDKVFHFEGDRETLI